MVTRLRTPRLAFVAVLAASVAVTVAAQAADSQYGPCCPVTHGSKFQNRDNVDPRYTCSTVKRISLRYGSDTQALDAIEVAGSLLVPARMFLLTGGDIGWAGGREVTLDRAGRTVRLTLGSHVVRIVADGKTTEASWDLCPRQRGGVTYVPLRPMAEALGLTVAWQDGVVVLAAGGPTPPRGDGQPVEAAAKCPADRVEEALKVKILRSPADSSFGSGAQVLELLEGSPLKALGVQASDVIVVWDGQRIKCPRDLDVQLAKEKADNANVSKLVVMRGADKLSLPAE